MNDEKINKFESIIENIESEINKTTIINNYEFNNIRNVINKIKTNIDLIKKKNKLMNALKTTSEIETNKQNQIETSSRASQTTTESVKVMSTQTGPQENNDLQTIIQELQTINNSLKN